MNIFEVLVNTNTANQQITLFWQDAAKPEASKTKLTVTNLGTNITTSISYSNNPRIPTPGKNILRLETNDTLNGFRLFDFNPDIIEYNFIQGSLVGTSMYGMFGTNTKLEKLVFGDNFTTPSTTSLCRLIYDSTKLKYVYFGKGFDTSHLTNFTEIFKNSRDMNTLIYFDISNFNLSKVSNFNMCEHSQANSCSDVQLIFPKNYYTKLVNANQCISNRPCSSTQDTPFMIDGVCSECNEKIYKSSCISSCHKYESDKICYTQSP